MTTFTKRDTSCGRQRVIDSRPGVLRRSTSFSNNPIEFRLGSRSVRIQPQSRLKVVKSVGAATPVVNLYMIHSHSTAIFRPIALKL
jgi:hypothetical protein